MKQYLPAFFYKTTTGAEPVRDWLKSLNREEKKHIGEDIKTVQFGWPLGMPLVGKIAPGIWEVRTHLRDKIARVFFTVYDDNIVLLHGFIKKTQKAPKQEIYLARQRLRQLKKGGKP
ncbi:type II toxin-antitoxin system RelE/ParE family toxin [candidate division FCPU426 bacterium]|nr:type II toxin-antitoxin system RelE/ParE family toxin [candidate division FCPU426 bacterium]